MLLVSALSVPLMAQQIPDFTLYNNNMLLINPAYAGISDGLQISSVFRKQWLGINGAPTTLSFSGHGYIPNFKVGVGIIGWQHEAGAFKQTAVSTNYSYRLDLGFGQLNFGLQVGIINYRTNYAGADLNGINDPLFTDDVNQTKFNWGGGAFLSSDKYYAGFSAPILATYDNNTNTVIKLDQHFYITGGYLFSINEKTIIKPNAMVRMIPSSPVTFNVGATAYYGEHFGLGFLYKSQKTVAFNIEVVFDKSFYLSYAYDLPGAGDISSVENGSHEFVLNYVLQWGGKEAAIRYY